MWTCPKCGEQLEDQFDSCWKCALPGQHLGKVFQRSPPRLKWFHYFVAAAVSYMVPWLAMVIGPVGSMSRLRELYPAPAMWLAMSVPCVITFILLLPFLRFRVERWLASGFLLVAWAVVFRMVL